MMGTSDTESNVALTVAPCDESTRVRIKAVKKKLRRKHMTVKIKINLAINAIQLSEIRM